MDKSKTFAVIAVSLLVAVTGYTIYDLEGRVYGLKSSNNQELTSAQLALLNITGPGTVIDKANNTVYVSNSTSLLVLMGPMNRGNMYSFEIYGLLNPTLVVERNVSLQFVGVNIDDDDSHNFILATVGPPYSYMGGHNMMGGYNPNSSGYGFMSTMPYVPPEHSGLFSYYNTTYSFTDNGTYWYLCTYPGHAQQGMYGKIIVL